MQNAKKFHKFCALKNLIFNFLGLNLFLVLDPNYPLTVQFENSVKIYETNPTAE